jgi:large subunit ribosomal protein L28
MVKYSKNIPKIGGVNMSRVCNICGKGQASGNNVSHSNRKTRRTFKVNVQKVSYIEDGKEINAYVCARCVRTLKKADAE